MEFFQDNPILSFVVGAGACILFVVTYLMIVTLKKRKTEVDELDQHFQRSNDIQIDEAHEHEDKEEIVEMPREEIGHEHTELNKPRRYKKSIFHPSYFSKEEPKE